MRTPSARAKLAPSTHTRPPAMSGHSSQPSSRSPRTCSRAKSGTSRSRMKQREQTNSDTHLSPNNIPPRPTQSGGAASATKGERLRRRRVRPARELPARPRRAASVRLQSRLPGAQRGSAYLHGRERVRNWNHDNNRWPGRKRNARLRNERALYKQARLLRVPLSARIPGQRAQVLLAGARRPRDSGRTCARRSRSPKPKPTTAAAAAKPASRQQRAEGFLAPPEAAGIERWRDEPGGLVAAAARWPHFANYLAAPSAGHRSKAAPNIDHANAERA